MTQRWQPPMGPQPLGDVSNVSLVAPTGQRCVTDDGLEFYHDEPPSRVMDAPTFGDTDEFGMHWENSFYYGYVSELTPEKCGGAKLVVSITAKDETARHDWRDFQQIKNLIAGPEWEAVELYPAESRLLDPSNRFYLWCFPPGVLKVGKFGKRSVTDTLPAQQRPFPKGSK